MDLGLTGKVYVVTGGTRGLGFAAAAALVADGARVVLSGRTTDSVETAVTRLGSGSTLGIVADNRDPDTPARLIAAGQARWDRLDGGLVSVGGPVPGKVSEVTDDDWRASFQTIFLGAVRLSKSIAAQATDGGSIALVLSTSVRTPIPGLAISNALRPALAMTVKDMADEFGPNAVRVNGLLPGRIDTERVQELDARAGDPDAVRNRQSRTIPLRRYGEPNEFGRVAAFVLSPAASYITGTMVTVDGGATRSF